MTIRSTISVVASANDHIENVNAQIKDLEERIGGKEVYRSAGDGTTVTMWCRACDHPFDVCSACKNIEALESELARLRRMADAYATWNVTLDQRPTKCGECGAMPNGIHTAACDVAAHLGLPREEK